MLNVSFHDINQLKGMHETFSEAYNIFLQSANIPPSLEDEIRRLSNQEERQDKDIDEVRNFVHLSLHVNFSFYRRVLLMTSTQKWKSGC